jgi:hypothetical protein
MNGQRTVNKSEAPREGKINGTPIRFEVVNGPMLTPEEIDGIGRMIAEWLLQYCRRLPARSDAPAIDRR